MLSSFFLSSQLWVCLFLFDPKTKCFLKACSRMNSFKTPHSAIQTLQVFLGQFFVWFVSLKLVQLSPQFTEFCCCSYIVLFWGQIHHRFCEQRVLLLFLHCSVSESNTSPILRTESVVVVPTLLCFWVKHVTDSANRVCLLATFSSPCSIATLVTHLLKYLLLFYLVWSSRCPNVLHCPWRLRTQYLIGQ